MTNLRITDVNLICVFFLWKNVTELMKRTVCMCESGLRVKCVQWWCSAAFCSTESPLSLSEGLLLKVSTNNLITTDIKKWKILHTGSGTVLIVIIGKLTNKTKIYLHAILRTQPKLYLNLMKGGRSTKTLAINRITWLLCS